ncbi:ChbG/HpnK family deacetylase [Prosthecomicrobium sp. N25]|uniref:ChbG/HpnK family deacetylase n=1 Tax=Prosthecomicrobium sp. N25 TaxID=3129254 RepID=UPI003078660A
MNSNRNIVLCADDYGLSRGVDAAVLDLVDRGRLSAVSCMVAGRSLKETAGDLAALADRTEIGLHLTLTDLPPLGPMPGLLARGRPDIGGLIRRSHARALQYPEIEAEVRRQIAGFEEIFGRSPDFVDGHQHVHVLPVIRRALLDQVRTGRLPATTWLRSCAEPLREIRRRGIEVAKAGFIAVLSRGLAEGAVRAGARANDSFRGVTNFRPDPSVRAAFKAFLTGPGERPVVMCHPGRAGWDWDPTDLIPDARQREYAYLASDAFPEDLAEAGARLGRMA